MECKDARRLITPFIERSLTDRQNESFLKHVEQCDDCMEELEIWFMVNKAICTLDEGHHHEDFDFRKQLEDEIRSVRHGIRRRRLLHICKYTIVGISEILLLFAMLTGYEIRKGEAELTSFRRAVSFMRYGGNHNVYSDIPEDESEAFEMIEAEEKGFKAYEIPALYTREEEKQMLPSPEQLVQLHKKQKEGE